MRASARLPVGQRARAARGPAGAGRSGAGPWGGGGARPRWRRRRRRRQPAGTGSGGSGGDGVSAVSPAARAPPRRHTARGSAPPSLPPPRARAVPLGGGRLGSEEVCSPP